MAGAKFKHVVNRVGLPVGEPDTDLCRDQTERRHFQGLEDSSHIVETTIGRKRLEESRNVLRRVDGGNDEVKTPGKFFQSPSCLVLCT